MRAADPRSENISRGMADGEVRRQALRVLPRRIQQNGRVTALWNTVDRIAAEVNVPAARLELVLKQVDDPAAREQITLALGEIRRAQGELKGTAALGINEEREDQAEQGALLDVVERRQAREGGK